MLSHAATARPHEACGVLLGTPQRITAARAGHNLAADPTRTFILDAHTLLDADTLARHSGLAIVGFYHSHPASAPVPSPSDRATMWPAHLQAIVDARHAAIAWWRRDEDRIAPVLMMITDWDD